MDVIALPGSGRVGTQTDVLGLSWWSFINQSGISNQRVSAEHCIFGDVWKRKGFRPVAAAVHCCEIVLKSC